MLVVGDFNHPDIEWSELIRQLNSNDKSAQVFLSNLNSNYIRQLVNEPTFSNNFLDLILTDDSCRVSEVSIGPPLGVSEKNSFHFTTTWKFAMHDKSLDNRVITKRYYQIGDYLRMSATSQRLIGTRCLLHRTWTSFMSGFWRFTIRQ